MKARIEMETTPVKFVTKAMALDRLIKERFLGDVPPAVIELNENENKGDNGGKLCLYDPTINGGCAVGCWLTVEEHSQWAGRIETKTAAMAFKLVPEMAEKFEDPTSPFWRHLQTAHDYEMDVEESLLLALQYVEPGQ